ncbi:disease resistance TIR-NBS-LRR class family protein, partial [Tanacetum coccineum]
TIKVLGSLLCGQNEPEWKDALERLKTIPLKETMKILELSYDALDDDYKEIFLDVACILKGWRQDDAVIALESCGFHARNGLRVLQQRSLMNISYCGYLEMHDHIEEMGKNIVRRVNPNEPTRHSRLWNEEDIVDILANDSGTQATKCIRLYAHKLNFEILMNGLANMKELRFLHVNTEFIREDEVSEEEVSEDQVSEDEVSNSNSHEFDPHLPNALRFLSWEGYPFSSLPKTFQAKNLVGLEMEFSDIVHLWKDGEEKACLKLRFLKFSDSRLRTLDLSVAPNLETLILEDCDNLVEVHFQVAPNLKELRIFRCERLEKLHMPAESPKLRSLHLNDSELRALHLGITPNLETLTLRDCTHMVELRMSAECPKLVNLDLDNLNLTALHLGITPNLKTLRLNNCTDMGELLMPAECPKLVTLDLFDNQKLRTLDLGLTPNLRRLILEYCYDLEEINAPAECLKKLIYLYISHCGRFKSFEFDKERDLPEVVSLSQLHLIADTGIFDPHNTWSEFQFSCYYKEDSASSFGNLESLISLGVPSESYSLEELSLQSTDIKTLPDSICMLKHLKSLKLKSCLLLEKLPVDIGRLEYLESLILSKCTLLQDLPNSICEMKRLKSLKLTYCIQVEKLPEAIGRLDCLKELNILGSGISHLPHSLYGLRGLRIIGDRRLLESCGLTPKRRRMSDEDSAFDDEMVCDI